MAKSATEGAERATRSSVSTRPATYGATARPHGGFELFSWYFFRISGVILIFLVIIHLTLNHVTTDVSQTVYDYVAARYQNPFWRVYDLVLETLALLHGLNGLRILIDDNVRSRGWRLAAQSTVWTIALVFWLMGTMTIITFQPGTAGITNLFGLLK
ncbi:MAG TPA: succinate dehydrogenase hydrophobic membrane anchor subunit [Ktedonobacterales bacterium]|nr:succinate dehydrogenase hydrophobic membrane anchor subunit [Ktedonobacterales bacterium]